MGYDLKPRNKNIAGISIGAFSWPIILQETGAGYVLGYGAGRTPGSYVYQQGNNGSPASNDGYRVSSTEAKMMAQVCNGYLAVQRFVNKQWDEMPPEERKHAEEQTMSNGKPLYRKYVHEDFLSKIQKFAEFSDQSKGFTIH